MIKPIEPEQFAMELAECLRQQYPNPTFEQVMDANWIGNIHIIEEHEQYAFPHKEVKV